MSKLNRAMAAVSMVVLMGSATAHAESALDVASFSGRTELMAVKTNFTQMIVLPAGKAVVATTNGDKQTDVHLFVYDEGDTQVGQDTSPGPQCNVNFTPAKGGTFKFVVKNEGPGTNNVTLKVSLAK